MNTSPSAQNALPFQFLNPRFRHFNQEVFDRFPLMSSGHFYLPRREYWRRTIEERAASDQSFDSTVVQIERSSD
jgi:hypothetical protein